MFLSFHRAGLDGLSQRYSIVLKHRGNGLLVIHPSSTPGLGLGPLILEAL